jgi:hypothetical protein
MRVISKLGWHTVCKLKVNYGGNTVSIWIDKHVCRFHIIIEDSNRICVVNAVSGYKLFELMTGNKPPPNISIVAGKVSLGFKMEEMMARKRLKEITCTVER